MHSNTSANNGNNQLTFSVLKACTYNVHPEFSQDHRHMLMVMAMLSDGSTLKGYHSQATIAAHMGCSERKVRRLMNSLPALVRSGISPVDVKRKRRGRADGTGRSSDEYTLVLLAQPAQSAASAPRAGSSTGKSGGLNRPDREAQPDKRAGDLLSVCSLSTKRNAEPAASAVPVANGDEKATKAHDEVHAHYGSEFKRLRTGAVPIVGPREHKAIKELLQKLEGNVPEVKRRITVGLTNWENETIAGIAANPDKAIKLKTWGGAAATSGWSTPAQSPEWLKQRDVEVKEIKTELDRMPSQLRTDVIQSINAGTLPKAALAEQREVYRTRQCRTGTES